MVPHALALPIFAITLFVSAFLLFLVQPMIGKMILPNLGGTPQVWNTCMVFFQTLLLAGYAYTHFVSTRLKLRGQLLVHGAILLIPLALLFLPILGGPFIDRINDFFVNRPPTGGNPVLLTLVLLLIVVGAPYFVVSTSAPLLQKWFTYTGHPSATDPYFLYGASNLGSMLSLVFYPVLIEPLLGLSDQSWTWAFGYLSLVIFFFVCVGMVWAAPPTVKLPGAEEKPEEKKEETKAEEKKEEKSTGIAAGKPGPSSFSQRIKKGAKQKGKPLSQSISAGKPPVSVTKPAYTEVRSDVMTPLRRLRWVALAAVPSSLMLGIITYISTDVSAIAMFWVIPLALYLLSFILVFSKWPVVWTRQPHTLMVISFPIIFLVFVYLYITGQISPIYRSISFAILAFFLTTMMCHGELAKDRPSPKHLTEFYLWMSVGGMLGGVFNALFAPVFFWGVAELPIALVLGCLLRPYTYKLMPVERPLLVGFCMGLGIVVGLIFSLDFVGFFLGAIGGAVVGLVMNFDRFQTNGWSETLLLALFPGVGEWADEKGRELKSQDQPASTEGEQKETKKLVKPKSPPDYYVLNYLMDVALPILVGIFAFIMYRNSSWLVSTVQSLMVNVLGFKSEMASYYGTRIGIYGIPLGIPILCALMFSFRPLRFALTIAAVFLVVSHQEAREGRFTEPLKQARTYFGVLKVYMTVEDYVSPSEAAILGLKGDGPPAPYTYLMHGTTHHGLNYQSPDGLRRLATTYYHRLGPVGVIMERLNWFPDDKLNEYHADVRMPVTLIGAGATPLGFSLFPTDHLVALWTEPPYCCIGLGTGTMASYARPYQHMTFYEIDETIRSFSLEEFPLPEKLSDYSQTPPAHIATSVPEKGPYFNYIHDALKRGAGIEVIMGDARLSMKPEMEKIRQEEYEKGESDPGYFQLRNKYYHVMEVDAFSSDAIPVHLITKEAIELYFEKMVPDGVVMVHTSNRHLDLVLPVTDIAKALGLKYRVGNDRGKGDRTPQGPYTGSGARGHFQSEYVMLAKRESFISKFLGKEIPILPKAATPEQVKNFSAYPIKLPSADTPILLWTVPTPPGNRLWTDDYSNMMSVFRWGFRH